MKTNKQRRLAVERLESRDAAGRRVSLIRRYRWGSRPNYRHRPRPGGAPPDGFDLTFTDGDPDGQLATLKLIGAGFNGARIVFSVTKTPGADGLAHVGFINASGIDLDRVVVKGDLGKIIAGDSITTNDPGLNLLQARSMGTLGLVTQGGMGDLNSTITGKLGALKILGDFTDASLIVTAVTSADGSIGPVSIGGDVTGTASDGSGSITSSGAMGDLRIGGNVSGGAGRNSAMIFSTGAMGDVRIGGHVTGGTGDISGLVYSNGIMGDVRVGGDLTGGAGGWRWLSRWRGCDWRRAHRRRRHRRRGRRKRRGFRVPARWAMCASAATSRAARAVAAARCSVPARWAMSTSAAL